jgi:DNA polymerase-3 subunit gamma/tau
VTLLNLLPSALNTPASFSSPQTTVTTKGIVKESTRPQSKPTEKFTKSAPSESSVNSQKDNHHQTVPSKPPLSNPPEETKPQSPPAQTSEIQNIESNSLPEIWQSVLHQVEWTTTKALLKQHCHLMSFDGKVAIIGIKNEKLFGLASSKINDIEKAFRKIYNSSIRIKLQVDQEKKRAKTSIDNSSVEETTSVAKEEESEIVNNVIETELNNQNGHEQQKTIEKAELANQNESENTSKIESQSQKDTVTIDAKKAAEHLAQFFNVEIVITEAKTEELDSEEIGTQNSELRTQNE